MPRLRRSWLTRHSIARAAVERFADRSPGQPASAVGAEAAKTAYASNATTPATASRRAEKTIRFGMTDMSDPLWHTRFDARRPRPSGARNLRLPFEDLAQRTRADPAGPTPAGLRANHLPRPRNQR
jgi:hypothetical protein